MLLQVACWRPNCWRGLGHDDLSVDWDSSNDFSGSEETSPVMTWKTMVSEFDGHSIMCGRRSAWWCTICQAAGSGVNLKVCSWSARASRIGVAVLTALSACCEGIPICKYGACFTLQNDTGICSAGAIFYVATGLVFEAAFIMFNQCLRNMSERSWKQIREAPCPPACQSRYPWRPGF